MQHKFYFANDDPTKFVQCSAHKQCWVMPCGPGTVWNQAALTCGWGLSAGDSTGEDCNGSCQHEVVCENRGSVRIDCGDGLIDIVSAFYGRTKPDRELCSYGKSVTQSTFHLNCFFLKVYFGF